MREFEIAELAVQAALDAGARYADVRVMHRRQEMLSARNGDIEAVADSADSGIGERALVGSGWGFYATADLDDAGVRAAGALEAFVAEAGLADAGRAVDAEALATGIGQRALKAVQLFAATDQRPPSRHGHTTVELRQGPRTTH